MEIGTLMLSLRIAIMRYLIQLFFLVLASTVYSQSRPITISGLVIENSNQSPLSFLNVVLKTATDSAFVTGTVTNELGRFSLYNVKSGEYYLEISMLGYSRKLWPLYVGSSSEFLDIGTVVLEQTFELLKEVQVTATQDEVSGKLDKKTYSAADYFSLSGGSVLQSLQGLPGITIQDGKILLRGNDKVAILLDNKQTALTGFGNQSGLDHLPSSSIDKIEIINNPSSKYDANGNGGIINIIMKKSNQDGWTGKVGFASGAGALWERKENLPMIRPQYRITPKINPSLSLNYRKGQTNFYLQADDLYTQTLNKNEFVTRTYANKDVILHQLKRNRNTNFLNTKAGLDWNINSQNAITASAFYGSEKIADRGDQPFFNSSLSERIRLWQFLEDELKTTIMASTSFQHKYSQPGHLLNLGFNYTFHRENEKYFFDNILPTYSGKDAFKLISDERVIDFSIDYIKPLQHGRIESGLKLRKRDIPTDMNFIPGLNSPLDVNAGGKATYSEIIPAVYGNYVYENRKFETELGLRIEYADLRYKVDPNHNTYKSDGYKYSQPFPNLRFAYKINDLHKLSVFFSRRVDRPNEVDIRVFPKYDDAEIIKVGNPALKPQFTNSMELGYKASKTSGYFYTAVYHRFVDGTITRISSIVDNSRLIYAIFQNAGKSSNTGMEFIWTISIKKYTFNLNLNGYKNIINAFSVANKYPVPHSFSAEKQTAFSGNIKWINSLKLKKDWDVQVILNYLAPDILPQGKIDARHAVDFGLRKNFNKGKEEFFINASDIFNTMIIRKTIKGNGFDYVSTDYYETQVFRIGYNYKF